MAETTETSNNDVDDDGPIVMNVHCYDPERFPHVVIRGVASNLSTLRGMDAQTRAAFFEERNKNSVAVEAGAPVLLVETPIPVTVTTTVAAGGNQGIFGGDVDDDNDNENCEPELQDTNTATTPEESIRGDLFVTNTQILFVAAEAEHSSFDLAIGGACVVLHAMTEDPDSSVYLQLSSGENETDNGGVTEVTLVPSSGGEDDGGDCQTLFDALCRLISLHPIGGDDDDGGGMFGFGAGGMIGGGFGDDAFGDYSEAETSDGLVWAPSASAATGGAATQDEREAMLEHLDNLLVVAPGLEEEENESDGQFDDATET
jgi:hypothetical protein